MTGLLELSPGGTFFEHDRRRSTALMSLLQLQWLVRLRWALVAGALAVLALERFLTPDATRPGALVVPILVLAIANLAWMGLNDILVGRFRAPGVDEPRLIRQALLFANAQIGVDLLLLTVILRYTGGVENPMALFYLFHMGIGALLLKLGHAVVQGIWAMLLYATLAVGEYTGWIPHRWEFLPQFPCPGMSARGEYVLAALVVMACGVFATLYFTLHLTGRLYARERQLREAYENLRRSEAAIFDLQQRRSRFLQTAAHQLKSPLASIETLVGLLGDRIVPPEALDSTYEKIKQRCREGIQQVSELLTLARVQRSDPRRHRRAVTDVGKAVRDVCAQYSLLAENRGITLKAHVPRPVMMTACIDPADLADCVGNLVDNAIKYTLEPGTVTVTVAAGEAPERLQAAEPSAQLHEPATEPAPGSTPGWIHISVCDTGIGIEPEALAEARDPAAKGSIFDAFRRGNNALAARVPGTGLGLAIVREVVEQAGGCILVRSRKGEGSRFTVVLPMQPAQPEQLTIRETRESLLVLDPPPAEHLPAVS